MFAGLGNEDSDEDGSTSSSDEEETPKPKPAKAPPQPARRGPALPEADDDESDFDDQDIDNTDEVPSNKFASTLLGGIDADDLEITIDTLKAISTDLTLFRSRPFKALREAIGPLARALTGEGGGGKGGGSKGGGAGGRGGGGGGGRQRSNKSTRLEGLSPLERYKQMDRDAMNHRVLRAERLARLEELQQGQDEQDEELSRLRLTGGDDPNASLNSAQGESLVPFQAKTPMPIPDGPAASGTSGEASAALLNAAGPARLHLARSCYICKRPYRELHAFYAQLCSPCSELNWLKRTESCK